MRFIEPLFPTPIHGVIINDDLMAVQQEMAKVISEIKWVCPESWGQTHLLSTTNFESDAIEQYNMIEFSKIMKRELEMYCEYIDFKVRNYTVTSWFNKFRPGDFGHVHTHGAVDISGVYYFQTNGEDGNLMLMSPNASAASSQIFGKHNQYWDHSPMVGKMLLFPGWLPHGIKRNNSDAERISFAFNIRFDVNKLEK